MQKDKKINPFYKEEVPSSKIDEDNEKWLEEFINKQTPPQNNSHYQPLQGA